MDKGNSLAANAACAIQRLRILPFTTGSALLQLQTDPHDRWKMECAFKLCTIHLPPVRRRHLAGGRCKGPLRDHSACWFGRKYQVPTSRILLLRPRFHPPLWFSAQTEKNRLQRCRLSPCLGESLAELGKAQCFFTFCQTVKIFFVFFIHPECLFG